MNYATPNMEIIKFEKIDIITVSDGGNADINTGNTGWVPNPNQ